MDIPGLTEKEAETSKQKYGKNIRSLKISLGSALAEAFSSLSVRLLIISMLIDIILSILGLLEVTPPFDPLNAIMIKSAAALLIIFAGTALIKSSGTGLLNTFRQLPERSAKVFRGKNKIEEISSAELAVGDIVFLCEGDIVPADGILIDGALKAEQSAVGLSQPAEKTAAPEGYALSRDLKDQYSLYGGSYVLDGSGTMKITAVGDNTVFAEKNSETYIDIPENIFKGDIRTSAAIGIFSAIIAAAVIFLRTAESDGPISGILKGISCAAVILAAVSLGRKGVVCGAMALSALKRLKQKEISVNDPKALVTAGRTDILMTENEGMITEGKYTVSGFIDGSGKEYHSVSEMNGVFAGYAKTAVSSLIKVWFAGDRIIYGNSPADEAMSGFMNIRSGRDVPKKQAEVSENGIYGAAVTAGSIIITMIRGEFDKVFERCGEYLSPDGKRRAITNKSAVEKLAAAIRLSGKSTIAFAYSDKQIRSGKIPENNFVFIGFMALQDRYSEDVPKAAAMLEKMKVRTMLAVSDSRGAAIFSAKYSGIKKSGGLILNSAQLGGMSRDELVKRFDNINAAADISGKEKLLLVKTAKLKGNNILFAGRCPEDIPAAEAADTSFAPMRTDISARTGASSAGKCGLSGAAELISGSKKFAARYRTFIYFKAVIALLMLAAVLFIGG